MSPIIINDPIYGFTSIPRGLLSEIIDQPEFQRLDHIRQLGTSSFVYPSAKHSRKQHSIGAFHLMQEALWMLTQKGEFIFDSEQEAVKAAILLHDVGHGPFSHVLEEVFMRGISHEDISLKVMQRLNQRLRGELSLAIKIFRNDYNKQFLHKLLSSQLDMDRMDYVNRDSFYCGVQEGSIGAARIIKMLQAVDDKLVVEHKGLNTVENYLMARRLMYWQVYLHKTVVGAEILLRGVLQRAKYLASAGEPLFASPALLFFLNHVVTREEFEASDTPLEHFLSLTDADILCAVGAWVHHDDFILSTLARQFVERKLLKAEVLPGSTTEVEIDQHLHRLRLDVAEVYSIPFEDTRYFVSKVRAHKDMYSPYNGIGILQADGQVKDVSEISNIITSQVAAEQKDTKTFIYYPRQLMEQIL